LDVIPGNIKEANMARVIELGPNPEVEKRINCQGCGAKIGYTLNDVQKYSGTDISGGPDGREWVVCPNCGKDITIRSW
jgi:hypothetical protein